MLASWHAIFADFVSAKLLQMCQIIRTYSPQHFWDHLSDIVLGHFKICIFFFCQFEPMLQLTLILKSKIHLHFQLSRGQMKVSSQNEIYLHLDMGSVIFGLNLYSGIWMKDLSFVSLNLNVFLLFLFFI